MAKRTKLQPYGDPRKRTDALLAEHGAELVRRDNHEVWRLPNGHNFVRACTPSDRNADLNGYCDLRRLLNAAPPDRGQPGERRERKMDQAPQRPRVSGHMGTIPSALAEQLSLTGLAQEAMEHKIACLENTVRQLRATNREQRQRARKCPYVRMRRRLALLAIRVWKWMGKPRTFTLEVMQ
jgi:hypothetical protein